MSETLREILKHFPMDTDLAPYGNGHINDTYTTEGPNRYILQKINTNIFKDPDGLMENIQLVTDYLREIIAKEGGDPNRETLTVIPTIDNKPYYTSAEGFAYRVYKFIEDSVTLEVPENAGQLYHVGAAFGKFQRQLNDFPADKLHETIPDFHDTEKRYEAFLKAVEADTQMRANSVEDEINFVKEYSKYKSIVMDGIREGSIPLRVTHNDTKINNVLLDRVTGEGVCVIDLDTVMPGSALYDFGDALRTGAATAAEDEEDLSKMEFDLEAFTFFAKGFLKETANILTKKEVELLPESALLMTYECGTRFLTDYLSGDTYFKIHRTHHNLHRAMTQFKLVRDIEAKLPKMHKIIDELI